MKTASASAPTDPLARLNRLDRKVLDFIASPDFDIEKYPLYLRHHKDSEVQKEIRAEGGWGCWSHNPYHATTDQIAQELGEDPVDVYYSVKFLRIHGFVLPQGAIDMSPPTPEPGGVVALAEAMTAMGEGREPEFIQQPVDPTALDLVRDKAWSDYFSRSSIADFSKHDGFLYGHEPFINAVKALAEITDRYGSPLGHLAWAGQIARYLDKCYQEVPDEVPESWNEVFITWSAKNIDSLAGTTEKYGKQLRDKGCAEPDIADILKAYGIRTSSCQSPLLVVRNADEKQQAVSLGFETVVWEPGIVNAFDGSRPVVFTFNSEVAISTLLPVASSLKVIQGLPAGGREGVLAAIEAAGERRVRLVVVDADSFLAENLPVRKVLLETSQHHNPIFYEQSINQLYAYRGMGKTNVALGLIKALTTGGQFLNWRATGCYNVLFCEGELSARQMQERVGQLVGPTNGRLRIITLDKQPTRTIPSLAFPAGQTLVEESIGNAHVLVLDSISTLFNIATNDEENWLGIQNWLKRLRSQGLCVLYLHHAGKSGMQRGSSKSEATNVQLIISSSRKRVSPRFSASIRQ